MANLFIANTTKQHNDFMYRTPEQAQVKTVRIPIGSQVCLGDLDSTVIDHIVKQHAKYGLISALEGSRRKGYNGLLYSIGKPVQLDPIMETFEENDTALDETAADRRAKIARAVGETVETTMREAGATVERTEVEMITETEGAKDKIAEGFETTAEGIEPRRGPRAMGGKGTLRLNR